MKRKLICSEDDCAPDALQYFDKEFEKAVRMNARHFMRIANRREVDDTIYYQFNRFELEFSADDPYYKLYELEDD